MMGVPVDGPSYIYGDNMSVINNTQKPESVLKKKSNSICYHAIHESVAMGESLTAHVATSDNFADLATKMIMNKPKRTPGQWIVNGCLRSAMKNQGEHRYPPSQNMTGRKT